MSFTTVAADNSGNFNFDTTMKEADRSIIRGMISPIMMLARVTNNSVPINRMKNFIINFLI